jgi:hypothetical protein
MRNQRRRHNLRRQRLRQPCITVITGRKSSEYASVFTAAINARRIHNNLLLRVMPPPRQRVTLRLM